MRLKDLHTLPKVRDSLSYIYVEHAKIEQEARSIAVYDADGKIPVPAAALSLLMLGPGTSITHAAVMSLADNGCLVAWVGEDAVRFYAVGTGETRSAKNLHAQALLWADPDLRLAVVMRMYRIRFKAPLEESLDLRQIRGKEGIRVREAYRKASAETGVEWKGRSYRRDAWKSADPVNRALSAANACLYGVCHAAIVSAGLSPALGFVHTGKMLSFVWDIADLYKADITIPAAFRATAESVDELERRVRYACRDAFRENRLVERIVPDIYRCLGIDKKSDEDDPHATEDSPGGLWDPKAGEVRAGVNRADDIKEEK